MYVFNKFSYKTTSSNDFFFELVSIAHVYGLTKYAVQYVQPPPPPPPPTNKPVYSNTISGSQKRNNNKK